MGVARKPGFSTQLHTELFNAPRTRHPLHVLAVTSSKHQLSLLRGTHKMHKDEPAQADEEQLSGVVLLLTTC